MIELGCDATAGSVPTRASHRESLHGDVDLKELALKRSDLRLELNLPLLLRRAHRSRLVMLRAPDLREILRVPLAERLMAEFPPCRRPHRGDRGVVPQFPEAVEVELHKGGKEVAKGTGAVVETGPLGMLTWLANQGVNLKAGEIITTGTMVPPTPAVRGDSFTAKFVGLGEITIRFTA